MSILERGARCGVRFLGGLCQIVGVINILKSDDNSANLALKCDQSEVMDSAAADGFALYTLNHASIQVATWQADA